VGVSLVAVVHELLGRGEAGAERGRRGERAGAWKALPREELLDAEDGLHEVSGTLGRVDLDHHSTLVAETDAEGGADAELEEEDRLDVFCEYVSAELSDSPGHLGRVGSAEDALG